MAIDEQKRTGGRPLHLQASELGVGDSGLSGCANFCLTDAIQAELKALLYVIRRVFGFRKDWGPISFNQFLKGIATRDGR